MDRSILVVDDDYFTRKLLEVLLAQDGFTVFQADNASQALNILNENSIDVITCDVMMPDMDGIAFLEALKSSADNAHIPVVIVTAAGRENIIEQAKTSGAFCVIEKPFTAESVRAAVMAAKDSK